MTQKCKITVLKPIDLVVLPPKKGENKFQLNRTIIEVTVINDPLVTFWISVCPKINIVPYNGEKGKKNLLFEFISSQWHKNS